MTVDGGHEVGRRKTDRPAASLTAVDQARIAERVAEESVGGPDVALVQGLADAGRGAGGIAIEEWRDGGVGEAVAVGGSGEQGRIALTLVPEAKALAGGECPDREPAFQDLAHEVRGSHRHQRTVEAQEEKVGAAELAQQLDLAAHGRQPLGRRRRCHHFLGVRLEGEHGQWAAAGGQPTRLLHHCPMAAMHAVEIADGDGAPLGLGRQVAQIPMHIHGPPCSTQRSSL